MCVDNGIIVRDSYSTFRFELLHDFHMEMSRFMELCLVHFLSSEDIYSHPESPAREQKRLSSVMMPLLKAFNAISALTEKRYRGPGLRVDSGKKQQTEQLSCPQTGDELRGMMERRNCCAVDTVFPFIESLFGRSLAFVRACDYMKICMYYMEMVGRLLLDHNEEARTVGDLASLLTETSKFKTVV